MNSYSHITLQEAIDKGMVPAPVEWDAVKEALAIAHALSDTLGTRYQRGETVEQLVHFPMVFPVAWDKLWVALAPFCNDNMEIILGDKQ